MVTASIGKGNDGPQQNTEPQARKARKRATDRLAQREHRRRQKLYVEELESQLKGLKHKSTANQVSILMEENGRLRNEVGALFLSLSLELRY